MYSEVCSLGPSVADTMGLSLSGLLFCTLGRKYILWVCTSSGRVSLVCSVISIRPSFLKVSKYEVYCLAISVVRSLSNNWHACLAAMT